MGKTNEFFEGSLKLIEKGIGEKIRELRKRWGLSQMELAERLGVSFQQVQKYEKGITKISVSRLKDVADALGVDIAEFFKEDALIKEIKDSTAPYGMSPHYPLNEEEIRLLKIFRKINSPHIRRGVLDLLRGALELDRFHEK